MLTDVICLFLNLLAEHQQGKTNYVYSYDMHINRIAIGKITNAFCSGHDEVYCVTFDNGKQVRATKNHIWITSNDEEIKTCDLISGTSLKPIFFEYENASFLNGYGNRAKNVLSKETPRIKLTKICKALLDENLAITECNWEVMRKEFYQGAKFDKILKHYNSIDELILDTKVRFGLPINHKVVSVEKHGTEDVYDITVDTYHNFALGCGVFVHNSWWMKNRGAKPHYKPEPKKKKSKKTFKEFLEEKGWLFNEQDAI